MKMVTKTFKMLGRKNNPFVLVNKALVDGLAFHFTSYTCCVSADQVTLACCSTPLALRDAWVNWESITFSVTLPAKYWE